MCVSVRRAVVASAAFLLIGLAMVCPAWAAPGPIITPYAGLTGESALPTPGPATSSALGLPVGTAVDSSGDVYIADAGNNMVEKVTPDGTLSVVAGTGTSGIPVPGPAIDSPLNAPYGVAVDQWGNLYIADSANGDVEMVTSAGALSIVAGTNAQAAPTPGPASSSALGEPSGVAVDSSGDLYVADTQYDVIEKISASGTLSILAGLVGTSAAPTPGPAVESDLDAPSNVATDTAGDVYIADTGQNLVEKITPAGILSIVAGDGISGLSVPGPATSSPLSSPWGLALDADGDLYVANLVAQQVDEVDPSGTLSIIAGNGTAGIPSYGGPAETSDLAYPAGLALNVDGTLYLAEAFYSAVDRIGQPTPGAPRAVALSAQDGSAVVSFVSPVDPGTSAITAYQISLDGGTSWQTINPSRTDGTLSSTLDDLTDGTAYTVSVRAVNDSGPGAPSLLASATPMSTTSTTAEAPTTTTTTTTATTTTTTHTSSTTSGADAAVTLSAQALRAGVTVSEQGWLRLPLACPATVSGCDADGTIVIALPGLPSLRTDAQSAPVSVIARFARAQIAAGQTRLLALRLAPATMRRLQELSTRRVRASLSTVNHLPPGPSVNGLQQLWLQIPAADRGCAAATGRLTATGIGPLALGMARPTAQREARFRRRAGGFERLCLLHGGIRVAYPIPGLLDHLVARLRHQVAGGIIIALTANHRYVLHGIRVGMSLSAARTKLALGPGIRVGLNTWYVISHHTAAWVLKVQHGVVREIGVTDRTLTTTRAAEVLLVRNL